jgi:hypothetical protein
VTHFSGGSATCAKQSRSTQATEFASDEQCFLHATVPGYTIPTSYSDYYSNSFVLQCSAACALVCFSGVLHTLKTRSAMTSKSLV